MEVIEIKSRWGGEVLYSGEYASLKEAVEAAVKAGADLGGADLGGADMHGADMHGANMHGADMHGANMRGANMRGANMRGANLGGASMRGADLGGADMHGANMRGANMRGADLCGADMHGANMRGANMRGADMHGANMRGANLYGADLCGADMHGAKVGQDGDEATLVGSRPVMQIGPIGSRNDWLLVFWCGDAGVRISAGCQRQITESYFLERLADAHGEGEQANIHAQHYIEALAFAKRLLKDQAEGGL